MIDLFTGAGKWHPYSKLLAEMVGSATASIFLQSVIEKWDNFKEPFYWFDEPTAHKNYVRNRSWRENLGFHEEDLMLALSKVGTKITEKRPRNLIISDNTAAFTPKRKLLNAPHLVLYRWDSGKKLMWYELNVSLLESALSTHVMALHSLCLTTPNFELREQERLNKLREEHPDWFEGKK